MAWGDPLSGGGVEGGLPGFGVGLVKKSMNVGIPWAKKALDTGSDVAEGAIGGAMSGWNKATGAIAPATAQPSGGNFGATAVKQQAAAPESNADKVMKSVEPRFNPGPPGQDPMKGLVSGPGAIPFGGQVGAAGVAGAQAARNVQGGAGQINPIFNEGSTSGSLKPFGATVSVPQNGSGVPGGGATAAPKGMFDEVAKASAGGGFNAPGWAAARQEGQPGMGPDPNRQSPQEQQHKAILTIRGNQWGAVPVAQSNNPMSTEEYLKASHDALMNPGAGGMMDPGRAAAGMRYGGILAQLQQGQQTQQAMLEHQRALSQHAQAQAALGRSEAGNPSRMPRGGDINTAERLAQDRAKTTPVPYHERLMADPEAQIGDFARGLAADKIQEGSPEWLEKMQGFMATRKTNPQQMQEANKPSGLSWHSGNKPLGIYWNSQQTPAQQENSRIIDEILRQNTKGAIGGM